MKTKKSVLVSAVAMLVLSGAAMGTGTFAWFTTSRQVTVNFSDVQVTTQGGNLLINYVTDATDSYTTSITSEGGLNIAAAAHNNITDISGNGKAFFKPNWSPTAQGTLADSMQVITGDEGYYIDFQLQISRSDTDKTAATDGFMVYLGSNTKVTAKTTDPDDVAAAASARVAIVNASDSVIFYHAYETDASYAYLAPDSGAAQPAIYGLDTYYSADASTITGFRAGALVNRINNAGTHTEPANSSPVIANLVASNVTTTVTVRVWLEGTDSDATNTASTGAYSVTLDFYALAMI